MAFESAYQHWNTEELIGAVEQRFDHLFLESNKIHDVVCVDAEFREVDARSAAVVESANYDAFYALSKYHDAAIGETRSYRNLIYNAASTTVLQMSARGIFLSPRIRIRNPRDCFSMSMPIDQSKEALGIVYDSLREARFLDGLGEQKSKQALRMDRRYMHKILSRL